MDYEQKELGPSEFIKQEDSQHEGKTSNKRLLFVITIVSLIAIFSISLNIVYFLHNNTDVIITEKQEEDIRLEEDEISIASREPSSLIFDISRFKIMKDSPYQLLFKQSEKAMEYIYFDPQPNNNTIFYDLVNRNDAQDKSNWYIGDYLVNFTSGQPLEAFVGHFNTALNYQKVIFLMDDGTIEYINPNKPVFEENTIKTNGKISQIPNKIVGIYQTSVTEYGKNDKSEGNGWESVVAEDEYGNYYDLFPLLEDTDGEVLLPHSTK